MIQWKRLPAALWPTSGRGRRAVAAAAMLAGATLVSASIVATGPTPEAPLRTERSWPVSVIEVEPQPHSPTFTAYGRMESHRIAKLRTDLVAEVAAVHVREGDWVAAGEVLVELADAEVALLLAERQAELALHAAQLRSIESEQAMLERTLAQARSMNRIAEDKLQRHRELMAARLISQSLLDEVIAQANRAAIDLESHERALADLPNRIDAKRAAVTKAQALVDRARLELTKTAVRAPFSGPVLAVNVAPGDRSSLGATLVELADAAAFEVRVQVPGAYEPRFQQHLADGHGVRAVLPNGQQLALTRLARRIQPGQSGLDAFFHLAGSGPSAPALGRVVDMRIQLPAKPDVVALPIAALYQNDRVYAVHDSRLQGIQVERVGEVQTTSGEYRVLVRSPELVSGRPVITTQLPKAASGLLVEAS
ncbi:MAG: HlyD family secretion protein [Pseudomonadales bacterium]